MRELTFVEAICEAQDQLLERYPDVFIIGEGVPDPKSVFGTCSGLADKYPGRVYDSPVSEAGVTGVCIGAAIAGMRPIHVHQRMDFSLYAADQIINNLAKWKSMFGLDRDLGMVIRMTVGRGWGAGNQHAQNLEALFAHIPGLQVIVPHDPQSAKSLLIGAVQSGKPTIFIEHKWLHNIKSEVDTKFFGSTTNQTLYPGGGITLVAWGAAAQLAKRVHEYTNAELVILDQLSPAKLEGIHNSVERTGKLLVLSDAWKTCGYASEIMATVAEMLPGTAMRRVTLPDHYVPSSHLLAKDYYPTLGTVYEAMASLTGIVRLAKRETIPHDVDPIIGKVVSAI